MMDRSIFVLRKGPVGWAVAWSGWRRARGSGVENDKLAVEKPCAAGRLSCGPISADDCCTYASNGRIQLRQEIMFKHCYRLRLLAAAQECSSQTFEAVALLCTLFASSDAVKTLWLREPRASGL